AAAAELEPERTRDAGAAGAPGAALFDARRGLARIWRGGAPATPLDARRLPRLPGFSPPVRHRASPRDRRRRARRDLRSQTRRQRVGAGDAARSHRADLARTAAHHGGRASPLLPAGLPPPPSSPAPPPPPYPVRQ